MDVPFFLFFKMVIRVVLYPPQAYLFKGGYTFFFLSLPAEFTQNILIALIFFKRFFKVRKSCYSIISLD